MAHFRGTLQGNRGRASRLGTKNGGLCVTAASWEGRVAVRLWYDEETRKDCCTVTLEQHHGNGCSPARTLYSGPVDGTVHGKED